MATKTVGATSVLAGTLIGALASCSGSERAPRGGSDEVGGTIVVAAVGEPDHLFPPLVTTISGKMVIDQIFEGLASLGPAGNTLGDAGFIPGVASRWSWSVDSSTIDFVIDPRARFHDGRAVSASDVVFSYLLYMDPTVGSPNVSSFPRLDSLVAVDSATVRAFFDERSPERFFKLVTNFAVLPRHLVEGLDRTKLAESPFAQAPVGSGPFRFRKWGRGTSIDLVADTGRSRERPGLDRVVFRYVSDLNAGAQSVVAGETDFLESTRPEGLALLTADLPVRSAEYQSPDHGYLLFNTRSVSNRSAPHPILGDRNVRRALGMAIDRPAVVRNALDSLARVSYGPFASSGWAADTTVAQLPHDVEGARRLLETAGWRDTNGDGVRERGGMPLRFTLLVPSVSATRRQMAVALQEQLKQVGADVIIDAPEPAVLFPRVTRGKFDAFVHVWHEDATPTNVAQAWSGRDLERSANYGWYANAEVDSLIDVAGREPDPTKAIGTYRQVYTLIVQDAPAIFLWEPRTFALAHKRIQFDALDGNAWWMGIRSWRIPVAARIPRDAPGA